MNNLQFQWDRAKNNGNYRKHGIQFEEAATVFYDENGIDYFDPDHSDTECRFLMLGMSRNLRVLVVSFCFRENDTIIRIISSRKANKKEIHHYFSGGKT